MSAPVSTYDSIRARLDDPETAVKEGLRKIDWARELVERAS